MDLFEETGRVLTKPEQLNLEYFMHEIKSVGVLLGMGKDRNWTKMLAKTKEI